jgi:hypothetical protein
VEKLWVRFLFCMAYIGLAIASRRGETVYFGSEKSLHRKSTDKSFGFSAAILVFDFHKYIAGAGLSAINKIFEVHKAGAVRLDFYNFQGVFAADNI